MFSTLTLILPIPRKRELPVSIGLSTLDLISATALIAIGSLVITRNLFSLAPGGAISMVTLGAVEAVGALGFLGWVIHSAKKRLKQIPSHTAQVLDPRRDFFDSVRSGNLEKTRDWLRTQSPNQNNEKGETPLQLAISQQNLPLVKLLIEEGQASLEFTSFIRHSPLHTAVGIGNLPIVQYLIEKGASPLLYDGGGCLPLHTALYMQQGNPVASPVLEYLAQRATAAEWAFEDDMGRTPVGVVTDFLRMDIETLLPFRQHPSLKYPSPATKTLKPLSIGNL